MEAMSLTIGKTISPSHFKYAIHTICVAYL
jgi:hypothetical protein